MYKLIIMIEQVSNWHQFDAGWPDFLAVAEQMPGLRRETTTRIDRMLHGRYHPSMIHELFFDSMQTLREALDSEIGQKTGEVLQKITGGQFTLLMADHMEDELSNIPAFNQGKEQQNDAS